MVRRTGGGARVVVGVVAALLSACSSTQGGGAQGAAPEAGSREAGGADAARTDGGRGDAWGAGDATASGQRDGGRTGVADGSVAPRVDARSPAADASPVDAHPADATHDVIVITSPGVDGGGSVPDSAPDAPKLDACGICDRVWVCNGFADSWVSTGPYACADVRHGITVATLYCQHGDTIKYADATNNDGTWAKTATGLALYYNDFSSTMEIDCTPGP